MIVSVERVSPATATLACAFLYDKKGNIAGEMPSVCGDSAACSANVSGAFQKDRKVKAILYFVKSIKKHKSVMIYIYLSSACASACKCGILFSSSSQVPGVNWTRTVEVQCVVPVIMVRGCVSVDWC